MKNEHILAFAKLLPTKKIPVWIRHVLVSGVSDDREDLIALRSCIDELQNVEKVEILPYHKLGVYKWRELGLDYTLEDVEPPREEKVLEAIASLRNK